MTLYEIIQHDLRTAPKKWLVTGVAGFIGSNLLETLLTLDQPVIGLDNFATGFQKNLDDVRAQVAPAQWAHFSFIEGDIRDLTICRAACEGADYVLHQAAMASVPLSIEDPLSCNEVNVTGFLNMLVAARDATVKKFVYASSCAVYGDDPALPKVETMRGRALSPYAAAKYMNELYADVFTLNYNLNCVGLRYFNIFGPRQDPHGAYAAVIPLWFSALINGDDVYINGDGETSRDFCYIDNCIQANLLAACAGCEKDCNQVYNVAYGERTTLNQLFALIRDEVSQSTPAAANTKPIYRDFRAGDIRHSLADISKGTNHLRYEPNYSVRDGLKKAAQWYANNM